MIKTLPWPLHERPSRTRRAWRAARQTAAWLLLRAGRWLDGLACALAAEPAASAPMAHEPVLEFHAEAGAPEGALYVDGRLVGHLPGVTRL